jgi:hypothetical protein
MPTLRLAAALAALSLWVTPQSPGDGTTHVFELSISGKSWQTGVVLPLGSKGIIGPVNNKTIQGVLEGTLPDFAADFLDVGGDDKVFLFYDGETNWRVGLQQDGDNAMALVGKVVNDGTFWMSGTYSLFGANGTVFVQGKVKFDKATETPKSVKGDFYFLNEDDPVTTGLVLKFKTKGKPLAP